MDPPTGLEIPVGKTLLLLKSIYGLRQAPREWNKLLHGWLMESEFVQSTEDPCLYLLFRLGRLILVLAIYVDDMTFAGAPEDVQDFERSVEKKFRVTHGDRLHWLLGIGVEWHDQGACEVALSQKQYIKDVLHRFGMTDANPASTPASTDAKLSKDMAPNTEADRKAMEGVPFREAVGCLLYLALGTRPDISAAVGVVARYCSDPGPAH